MTSTTFAELLTIADRAASYITKLNGGDYWTAPSWSIKRETVRVEAVYDEAGEDNAEAAELLEKQLN